MQRPQLFALLVAGSLLAACSSGQSSRGHASHSLESTRTHAAPAQVFVSGLVEGAMDTQHFWYVNGRGSACASVAHTNLGSMLGKTGPDDDVHKGTQVVVTNASGTVVGVARLGAGSLGAGTCDYSFYLSVTPSGSKFFTVKVGSHSETIPASKLSAPVIHLG